MQNFENCGLHRAMQTTTQLLPSIKDSNNCFLSPCWDIPIQQRWRTYLLSRATSIVDYRWRAANNNILYPKILSLSYYEGQRFLMTCYQGIEASGLLSKYLLIMKLRFDAILSCELGNENSDASHIKSSCGPHLACRPQVPHPCVVVQQMSVTHTPRFSTFLDMLFSGKM